MLSRSFSLCVSLFPSFSLSLAFTLTLAFPLILSPILYLSLFCSPLFLFLFLSHSLSLFPTFYLYLFSLSIHSQVAKPPRRRDAKKPRRELSSRPSRARLYKQRDRLCKRRRRKIIMPREVSLMPILVMSSTTRSTITG